MAKTSHLLKLTLALVGWSAFAAAPAADDKAPKVDPIEPGITRQQADAIIAELREMRLLLDRLVKQQPAAPAAAPQPLPPSTVTVKLPSDAMMLGDKNAPVTMVEYIDLQCP